MSHTAAMLWTQQVQISTQVIETQKITIIYTSSPGIKHWSGATTTVHGPPAQGCENEVH